MILSIAIISLVGLIIGIIYDFSIDDNPNPRLCLFAVSIIAWWSLCMALSIILICLAIIWLIMCQGVSK